MDANKLLKDEMDFDQINKLYDECLNYLKTAQISYKETLENVKTNTFVKDLPTEIDENNKEEVRNRECQDPNYETLDKVKVDTFVEEQLAEIDESDKNNKEKLENGDCSEPDYESIKETPKTMDELSNSFIYETPKTDFKVENEKAPKNNVIKAENATKSENARTQALENEVKSERLRRLSQQLPRIIITQSNTSLDMKEDGKVDVKLNIKPNKERKKTHGYIIPPRQQLARQRPGGYGDFPHRLMCKNGLENVALISNVPYEKIRMLNDTFHTLINLRWRWIVSGTIVLHFTIWLVFAVFWYIAALAHYDFEPDPPKRTCVTGGKDFVTIFLASVEAQTTIGFGDRTIDEECPESIFLFIMQLILGTGLSGVLTCVVYAKLTRPEKMTRDGVGFSKKAVISMRDGQLCLMMRAWDLNHDHIISSEFCAHFVKTHRTQEGEVIRYYARSLDLQERQFLLWPITLVHVIDETSPLYGMTPQHVASSSYEITVSLKGASASMGTFTQSQTSYLPKEVAWGYRFPPVVKYDSRKQKYVIDDKKLDLIEPLETPLCSASQLFSTTKEKRETPPPCPGTPSSFGDRMSTFHLERSSSFRSSKNETKA